MLSNMMHFNTTHGLSMTNAYKSWQNARARCTNPNNKDYKHYGDRGIGMEPDWAADFAVFYAEMGERPDGFTLERIDVNKGYVRGNCTWVPKAQQNNNKRNSHFVTYNGKTQTIADWSKETGIPFKKLQERLAKDWELSRVFSNENFSIRHNLTLGNETMCVADWATRYGINESTIRRRLRLGWSVSDAITTPVEKMKVAA
jgi:hypothetical protein